MSCSTPHRKIASNLLLRGGEFVANPVVEVDREGRIVSVSTLGEGAEMDRSVNTEFYNGIMVAGLVNAHCHIELSYLEGQIERGGGFKHFASRIGEVRGLFSVEQRQEALTRADAKMWSEGVVAVGDIVNGDSSFEMKGRSGIEYRTFAEVFGLRSRDTSAVDELLSFDKTSLTQHSTYSVGDALFREIAHNGDEAPLSIHFMESPSERELFEGRGEMWEWYRSLGLEIDFCHYGSPAERLIASVPRDRRVLLVHNCTLEQRDVDIIMEHFTAPVYWCVSPRSNDYISGLTPPLELLRRNNLNICIGTDSLASNESLSMLSEIDMMQGVPLAERLDWATRRGAEALGFDHLGEIAVGKRPSINILSGVDYERMELCERSHIRRIV